MQKTNIDAAFQSVRENSNVNGQQRNSTDNTTTLDLHTLRVAEVEVVLDSEMEKWKLKCLSEDARTNNKPHLHIITGQGNRSRNNTPRLQPAVCQYLLRNGWKFETMPGSFLVYYTAR